METEIQSLEEFNNSIRSNAAVLAFFSSTDCGVCTSLKPKITDLIARSFPKISILHVNMSKTPDIHGQYRIFTAPTIVVFFEGKIAFMKSRNLSIVELEHLLESPYRMLFDE